MECISLVAILVQRVYVQSRLVCVLSIALALNRAMSGMTVEVALAELAMVGELCNAQVDAGVPEKEVHDEMLTVWLRNLKAIKSADNRQRKELIETV